MTSQKHAQPDVIGIIESAYCLELGRDAWLKGVLATVNESLGFGCGVGGVLYRLGDAETVHVETLTGIGTSEAFQQVGIELHSDPSLVRQIHQSYRTWPLCGSFRDLISATLSPAQQDTVLETYARHGVFDQVILHGKESSGIGIEVLIFTDEPLRLPAQQLARLERIATHLATAYRLHRRLNISASIPAVEAILDAAGHVTHAEAAAQSTASREELSEAVRLREWARGRIRHDAPQRALEAWKGMIDARWTLVDQLESDGKRYILARENIAAPRAGAGLSQREREVAALAALDRSNKVIAYELGIAHSTVRVLLGRACAKLGVRSRADLVAKLRSERAASPTP